MKFFVLLLAFVQDTEQSAPTLAGTVTQLIPETQVRKDLTYLAHDKLEGRMAGEKGGRLASDFIRDVFKKAGLKPAPGQKTYFQPFKFTQRMRVRSMGRTGRGNKETRNVLGYFRGSDPKLRDEVIILGAHFDHCGRTDSKANPGRIGGSLGEDDIFNGANDNASGSTALVAIAKALGSGKLETGRSILLIAFGAEEHGLLGSRWYADHPVIPNEKTFAMINMDSIGRMRDEKNESIGIYQITTSSAWKGLIRPIAKETGVKLTFFRERWPGGMSSDHVPFARKGVKSIGLFTGVVPERHKPNDESERIDFKGLTRIVRMVLCLAVELANRAEPLPD